VDIVQIASEAHQPSSIPMHSLTGHTVRIISENVYRQIDQITPRSTQSVMSAYQQAVRQYNELDETEHIAENNSDIRQRVGDSLEQQTKLLAKQSKEKRTQRNINMAYTGASAFGGTGLALLEYAGVKWTIGIANNAQNFFDILKLLGSVTLDIADGAAISRTAIFSSKSAQAARAAHLEAQKLTNKSQDLAEIVRQLKTESPQSV